MAQIYLMSKEESKDRVLEWYPPSSMKQQAGQNHHLLRISTKSTPQDTTYILQMSRIRAASQGGTRKLPEVVCLILSHHHTAHSEEKVGVYIGSNSRTGNLVSRCAEHKIEPTTQPVFGKLLCEVFGEIKSRHAPPHLKPSTDTQSNLLQRRREDPPLLTTLYFTGGWARVSRA